MAIKTVEHAETVKKITGILEIYADRRWDEVDWAKVSAEIYEIVLSDVVPKLMKYDLQIAENIKDFWRHLQSGAER